MREKSRVTPETLLPYRRRRAALGKNVTGRPSACPGRRVPVPGPVAGHAQGWRAGMNATSRTWLPSDGSTRLSWHSQSEQTGMSTAPAVSRDRLLGLPSDPVDHREAKWTGRAARSDVRPGDTALDRGVDDNRAAVHGWGGWLLGSHQRLDQGGVGALCEAPRRAALQV